MADGVPVEDVYKVMSTPEGMERAYAKLDTIKPEIQWWEAGAQAPEWLISGDVANPAHARMNAITGADPNAGLHDVWVELRRVDA